ncbi:MAG: sugar transferase [Alphaproteobacteria bacterium]|nr:sugar transferase [Alphaproteobacteria bacterium]
MGLVRRTIDIGVAAPALVLSAPLILFGIAATRMTTPGPGLFRQTRYGLHGKPFTIYKIRSMTNDVDAAGSLLPDQDRLTPTGKFLRRWSIDELPQLWNIVKGDMTLIGPRPMPVEHDIPGFKDRYRAKPGLTGLAQVQERGRYSMKANPERRLQYDLMYVARAGNFCLNMWIVWKTITTVFGGKDTNPPPRGNTQPPDFTPRA